MSSFALPIALSARVTRSVAVAALLGATMLASPLSAAPADTAPLQMAQTAAPATPTAAPATPTAAPASTPAAASTSVSQPAAGAPASPPAATAAEIKAETVEDRITSLHTALQITPNEESKWNGVAKAMRTNAAAIEKLAADKTAQASQGMTAVDDLKTYEKFARAHVAGLKKLDVSFEKLYNSMPDPQKKIADDVFQNFGHHEGAASHS
jgi:protein CpxP